MNEVTIGEKNKSVLSVGSVGKGRKLLNAIIKTLFKQAVISCMWE
jgi:hypothetical protein